MTGVDRLWYLADEAAQQAERTYHRLTEQYDPRRFELERPVSRDRFRTVVDRIRSNGLPYGAQVLVRTPDGAVLLVKQRGLDQWVVPGGQIHEGESIRAGAKRELHEEAGIDVEPDGLGLLGRVEFVRGGHETWGVLPVFEAQTDRVVPSVNDPDEEILDAAWFDEVPDRTRDRAILERYLESV